MSINYTNNNGWKFGKGTQRIIDEMATLQFINETMLNANVNIYNCYRQITVLLYTFEYIVLFREGEIEETKSDRDLDT